ncbi:malonyl CoA-ACP transacylase [Alicyclobacillus ferrooxydans]|uniref:Malonyl CoA-acyl carrier protein transacylase n=1 Tax=Alicyclobacillus ferrooxydans TaxID=471514 RepID=A0A0P9CIB2_9BACL|nr:malonyl CoA-ACP transacylase [Alicyclobacillus ferrooxydans]
MCKEATGLNLAFVFPGQGAQYVGMGRELIERYPIAAQTFKAADAALGFALSEIILSGPEETLKLTYHAQPALLTASIAAFRVFQEQSPRSAIVSAGHSLGEYSALVAAGVLEFQDAVKLVYQRGRFMDEAVPAGEGAMAAVLGLDEAALEKVCEEATHGDDLVEMANMNCPGQIAISGTAEAVSRASVLAKAAGAKRVIPLVVSGPFHCQLMRPAAGKLSEALGTTQFQTGRWPVVANVDAVARTDAEGIRLALEQQLYKPVRFQDDVLTMRDMGVDTVIEFGPGTVLSGLIRKTERGLRTLHVEDMASLEETLSALAE